MIYYNIPQHTISDSPEGSSLQLPEIEGARCNPTGPVKALNLPREIKVDLTNYVIL